MAHETGESGSHSALFHMKERVFQISLCQSVAFVYLDLFADGVAYLLRDAGAAGAICDQEAMAGFLVIHGTDLTEYEIAKKNSFYLILNTHPLNTICVQILVLHISHKDHYKIELLLLELCTNCR